MMDKTPIRWQTYEYIYREKSSDWFWAVGIISISIAATAVILNNILFAILIIVGAFALSLHAVKKPSLVNYEVGERGVTADKLRYPYGTIESFWVEEDFGQPKLLLRSQKMFMPIIALPIENVDPKIVREYISAHLTEQKHEEPLLQKIMEYLGF